MQSIDALSDALTEARAETLLQTLPRVLQARHWPAVMMQNSLHSHSRERFGRYCLKHGTCAACTLCMQWVLKRRLLSGCGLGRQFEGGVVVISHDSQLLSVVCDDEERAQVCPSHMGSRF